MVNLLDDLGKLKARRNTEKKRISMKNKAKKNETANAKLMMELIAMNTDLNGVIWLVKDKVGISYKLVDKKIKACLRIYTVDFACVMLDTDLNSSFVLNTEHPFVRADIKLSLEGNCFKWEGDIEYKHHNEMVTLISKEGILFCLPNA